MALPIYKGDLEYIWRELLSSSEYLVDVNVEKGYFTVATRPSVLLNGRYCAVCFKRVLLNAQNDVEFIWEDCSILVSASGNNLIVLGKFVGRALEIFAEGRFDEAVMFLRLFGRRC